MLANLTSRLLAGFKDALRHRRQMYGIPNIISVTFEAVPNAPKICGRDEKAVAILGRSNTPDHDVLPLCADSGVYLLHMNY